MTTFSGSGFAGGTKASPAIAPHPMGLTSRAGHGFLTGAAAQVLDADSPEVIRIVSPASAINQDLPTTGVKAGRVFRLVVSGATETNYVALRSSGGNEIDRIGSAGSILVQALIDTPTTAAHWEVLDVFESNVALTLTGVTGANTGNISARITRRNRQVTAGFSQVASAAVAASNITIPTGSLPARFRPITQSRFAGTGVINNNALVSAVATIGVNGDVVFVKYDNSNFSGTSGVGNAGGPSDAEVSYRI